MTFTPEDPGSRRRLRRLARNSRGSRRVAHAVKHKGGSSLFANTTHSGSGRGFALAASAFATFVLFPAFTVAAEDRSNAAMRLTSAPGGLKGGLELLGLKGGGGGKREAGGPKKRGGERGESKSDTIGPWKIEAVFKGDMFDRCSINRTLKDDIVATFVRTGEGLSSNSNLRAGSSKTASTIR